ncbi:DUF488 domain-containing protein [Alkalilimnicola ehrlichii MLHE-1]|uniref:Uroporphyrin-III C-methyltransferase n=1 Tax=Alkalilimnicola ehrlichii (strain ATCC BAA-1101 / DSM 17681 / MLHE-1) TaxID=187272 RepID=Q0AB34_ALKEH|nr:protein of unknown function DUF488 [Alkalilimnicola ehrlichii MLHE-1]
MAGAVRLKRVYDPAAPEDGTRVLVDRVWPRGMKREALRLDHWLRELAPSTALRRWFAHEPERWPAFRERYRQELAGAPEVLGQLLACCRRGDVTLLYAARDRDHNQAVVLREVLLEALTAEQADAEPASSPCYGRDFPGYFGEE